MLKYFPINGVPLTLPEPVQYEVNAVQCRPVPTHNGLSRDLANALMYLCFCTEIISNITYIESYVTQADIDFDVRNVQSNTKLL